MNRLPMSLSNVDVAVTEVNDEDLRRLAGTMGGRIRRALDELPLFVSDSSLLTRIKSSITGCLPED